MCLCNDIGDASQGRAPSRDHLRRKLEGINDLTDRSQQLAYIKAMTQGGGKADPTTALQWAVKSSPFQVYSRTTGLLYRDIIVDECPKDNM